MKQSEFYQSLSPLEQTYYAKLAELFALVSPQQPEKGIQTLIQRAHQQVKTAHCSLNQALEEQFLAAQERTYKRLALLRCQTN